MRAILIGGFLGLLLLLRSQSLFLIPVILLILFLQRRVGWPSVLREAAFFLVGIVLVISPWIIRNGIKTGDFALDQSSQAVYVAQRYASSIAEAENTHLDASSSQVNAHILNYTVTHPLEVAGFIGAHFLNNELATIEVLPLRMSFADYQDNFQISSLFWLDGIKSLSGDMGFAFLNPLLLASDRLFLYKMGWADFYRWLFRFHFVKQRGWTDSGWRCIKRWIGWEFYFCLGFAELLCGYLLHRIYRYASRKEYPELPAMFYLRLG